jgi:hypothetical protein
MALRVSRQVSEVLAEGSGEIRVSRQIVEVLGTNINYNRVAENTLQLTQEATYVGPKWVYAQSILAFDQSAYVPTTYVLSAESVLTELSVALDVGGTRRLDVESVLALNHFGDNIIKVRHEESILNLTQAATGEKVYVGKSQLNLTQNALSGALTKYAESTLNLTQSASYRPLPQFAESTLELTQTAWASMLSRSEEHTLNLTHDANVQKPIRVSAESFLTQTEEVWNEETYDFDTVDVGLRQSAVPSPQLGVSDLSYLSFSQVASAGHVKASGTDVSATNSLSLTHSAIVNLTGDSTSILVLTHDAWGEAGKPSIGQLNLTHSASVVLDRVLGATSSLDLNQAATYTLILASTKCQYSPFVGSSTDPNVPPPPSTTLHGPMAGIQVPFQLVYPSIGDVTDAVSLKAPNLGNKDRLSFNRILRETRGGTMIVYADPTWPKIQSLVLSFSGLLNVEAQELLTFFEDHLGQEIGLIDWEHRYWRGVIVTPDEPIVEDQFDSFTATFEFEGELDPDWNPQVVPPSLRYSAIRTPQEEGYYVPNEPILPSVDVVYYSAETDSPTKIGSPLYLTGASHVDLARANAAGTVQVVGLALEVVAAGFSCNYISEGAIERSNWSEIAGTANLSAGVTYFLDPSLAGRITTTAPTTAGQYVVRVGRAVSTTTLDIEIELPILL